MLNRGWWRSAVGGWRLVVGGGWWLPVGGHLGRSLTKKKAHNICPPRPLRYAVHVPVSGALGRDVRRALHHLPNDRQRVAGGAEGDLRDRPRGDLPGAGLLQGLQQQGLRLRPVPHLPDRPGAPLLRVGRPHDLRRDAAVREAVERAHQERHHVPVHPLLHAEGAAARVGAVVVRHQELAVHLRGQDDAVELRPGNLDLRLAALQLQAVVEQDELAALPAHVLQPRTEEGEHATRRGRARALLWCCLCHRRCDCCCWCECCSSC